MGAQQQYRYHIVQHAWNSYLRLVDIDYSDNFCCSICKENPLIILDGIAMGTTKRLPVKLENIDASRIYSKIPLKERIYIANSKIREILLKFTDSGIDNDEFTNILSSIQPEFAQYIIFCSESHGTLRIISDNYPLVPEIIRTLSQCESITAITRITAASSCQRKLLAELAKQQTVSLSDTQALYLKMNFLKLLINSLQPNIDIHNNQIILQENVASLLESILKQIQFLLRKPTRELLEENESCDDFFNCFPALLKNFR